MPEMLIHKQQYVEILKIQKYRDVPICCVKISLFADLLLKIKYCNYDIVNYMRPFEKNLFVCLNSYFSSKSLETLALYSFISSAG